MTGSKVAIAYIPVLHKGYLNYVTQLASEGVTTLYVVSDDILMSHDELDYINRKDRLRALPQELIIKVLTQCTTMKIESLTISTIMQLHEERVAIVAPREDINLFIIETYFGGHPVTFHNVFLRWNTENLGESNEPQGEVIQLSDFLRDVASCVVGESEKSADWWRQVGAAVLKDGAVIACAHNEHMPEKELPNIVGDTRSLFKKGDHIDYVTAAHAEVSAIGELARMGIQTEDTELFVTDFPCPYCARLVAKSGIKKVYYMRGYAVLGGDVFFKDLGIEVVRVQM